MKIRVSSPAIALVFLVLLMTVYLIPNRDSVWTISASEIDKMLYDSVADYQNWISRDAIRSHIFSKAINTPGELSAEEVEIYVSIEQQFFRSWEIAWTYSNAGYLSVERYRDWESWYIGELQRRPELSWSSNRMQYDLGFAQYVDRVLEKMKVAMKK